MTPRDTAELEEVPIEDPDSPETRAWRRVRAGLLVELGLVPARAAEPWQEAVLEDRFDADACADELAATALSDEARSRLVARAGSLERDLLMAPVARGKGGRRRSRSAAAALVAQLWLAAVWVGLGLAAALLARSSGFEFDAALDRLLGVFG